MPRNDQQLVTALASCQAAPNGFGPEHASLCHEAAERLLALSGAEQLLAAADDTNRRLLREVAFAHLTFAKLDRRDVERAIGEVMAEADELAPYAPKLDGRPGPQR